MAKKKNGGDFFSRVEAFEKKHDKTPAQRQARQNRYIRRQARTPVFRNGAERAVYNTAHKAYRTAARAIRKYSKAYEKSPEYKYRQRVMNRDDAVSRAGRKVIRKLYKNDFGRGVLGAAHGLASGVTFNVGDLAAQAEGYKDYDAYHRAHTKYHALTKEQEKKLKSSKAYKRGAVVGDLASYATGYAAAGKAIAKGATKVVEKKAAKSLVEHAAEHGAEALGKGAVKRAAVRGAEKAATKTARKTSGIVGKAVGKMVKADVKAETKAAVKSAGGKISRKELNKAVEKRVANMTGKEARKYSRRAAERVAKNVAKDAIGDLTVGAAMDVSNELKNGVKPIREGKDGKLYVNGRFVRDMGVNAATNIVTGGLMDTVPGMVKGVAKDVKGGKKTVERAAKEGYNSAARKTAKSIEDTAEKAAEKVEKTGGNEVLDNAKDAVRKRFKETNGISVEQAAKRTGTTEDDVIKTAFRHNRKTGNMNLREFESGLTTRGKRAAAKREAEIASRRTNRESIVTSARKVSEAKGKLANGKSATVDGRELLSLKRRQKSGEFGNAKLHVENHSGTYYTVKLTDGVSNVPADKEIERSVISAPKNKTTLPGGGERTTKGLLSEFAKERRSEVRRSLWERFGDNAEQAAEETVQRAAEEAPGATGSLRERLIANRDRLAQVPHDERNAIQTDITREGHATYNEMFRDKGFVDYMEKNGIKQSTLTEQAKEDGTTIGEEMQKAYSDYQQKETATKVAAAKVEPPKATVSNSERIEVGEITLDDGTKVKAYSDTPEASEVVDTTRGGARGVGESEGVFRGHESATKDNIDKWLGQTKEQRALTKEYEPSHYGEKSQWTAKEMDESFNKRMRDSNDGESHILKELVEKTNNNQQLDGRDLFYSGRLCQYYQNALKETGNSIYAQKLAQARTTFSIAASEAGKTLQAVQNFYHNTPAGRIMTIERTINRFGKTNGLLDLADHIDKDIIDRVANATSKDELHAAEDELNKAIWSQVPATWRDKLDAWRYFSMLSSPKTHIRNVLGNALVMPMRGARNLVEIPFEKSFEKSGRLAYRTKSVVTGKLKKEYVEVSKTIEGDIIPQIMEGTVKYGKEDGQKTAYAWLKRPGNKSNFNSDFWKKVFAPLEKTQHGVSWALEKEDEIAVKTNFRSAFASYMKANSIAPSAFKDLTQSEKNRIIEYASSEALVATYRSKNAFASWLSRTSRQLKNSDSVALRGVSFFLDSAVPFTKTPVNILKTSLDFSPAGFFTGVRNIVKSNGDTNKIIKALNSMQGAGELGKQAKEQIRKACQSEDLANRIIDAAENFDGQKMRALLNDDEFKSLMREAKVSGTDQEMLRRGIDQVCSGFVGTPVLLAGIYLGKTGMAQGSFDNQSQYDRYRKSMGEQEFSFRIGDNSYTFNWAVPVAMPFAIGVNVGNQLQGDPDGDAKGLATASAWLSAAGKSLDPVTSLSMLSGIQNALDTTYSTSSNAFTAVAKNTLTNYVSQFIPTLGGQIAQTFFTDKQLSSASTNTDAFVRSMANQFNYWKSRIPLVNRTLPKNYDVYGQDTNSPNFFDSIMNPSTKKEIRRSGVDDEIRRLYKETGDTSVLPKSASANELNGTFTITVDGMNYHMSNKDYAEYKRVRGEETLKGLDKLFNSSSYDGMSNEDKKSAISKIYQDAKYKAKKNFAVSQGVSATDYDYENVLTDSQRAKFKLAKKAGASKAKFTKYITTKKSMGAGQDYLSKALAGQKAGLTYKQTAAAENGNLSVSAWESAKRYKTDKRYRKYYKMEKSLPSGSGYEAKTLTAIKAGARTKSEAASLMGKSESSVYNSTWEKAVYAYNHGVSLKFMASVLNDNVNNQLKKDPSDRYRDPQVTYNYILRHYKTRKERQAAWNLLKYDYRTWNGYGF